MAFICSEEGAFANDSFVGVLAGVILLVALNQVDVVDAVVRVDLVAEHDFVFAVLNNIATAIVTHLWLFLYLICVSISH